MPFPPTIIKPRLQHVTISFSKQISRSHRKTRKRKLKLIHGQNSLFWFTDQSFLYNRKEEDIPSSVLLH